MRIIRAGTVFDGERVRRDCEVVVDDGRIVEVRAWSPAPEGVKVIDFGPGTTILPGLVDGHQHLSWGCTPAVVDGIPDDPGVQRALILSNARRALAGGVTTVADLGDSGYAVLDLRDACRGDRSLPRILASGPPLTTPGGHCHFLAGAVTHPGAVASAVAERADRGVDVIKVMASGGNITPGSLPWDSQLDATALRTLVRAAGDRGLPVAAHAHGGAAIRDCVMAGVHTIEHGTFMTAESVEQDPEIVHALAASGIVVRGTPGVVPGGPPLPPAVAERAAGILAGMRHLVARGVRVVVSSDAGIGPGKPHDVMAYGVIQAGDLLGQPMAALTAATAHAADALGLGAECGRLASSRAADLLVVRGDATADLSALLEVEAVYREGDQVAGRSSRPRPAH